jgi:Ca-activated chloride channel homolog
MRVRRVFPQRTAMMLVLFSVLFGAACQGQPPDDTVEIALYSSSTKEDWVNAVTETFNAARLQTASGKLIQVRVTHVNSGGSHDDILAGKIQPTLWSPGDQSWVASANQQWQAETGRLLILAGCPETVYEPTGFAMWRPMAEALGWPDQAIGWEDILRLAEDPAGWARYGHAEWGQLKLGHTDPNSSNSGLLILTALAYSTLDLTEGLTPEQVQSEPVVEAMRLIERRTVHHEAQSRLLIERMVLGGPDELHAVNTNEAEVLKSNTRYGKLLPYPLAFVFPAEGSFWAGHPMCVMDTDSVTPEQREAAEIYTRYLLEPEQQALAVTKGLRPANSVVPLHSPITLENGTDPRLTPETSPALISPSTEVTEAIQEVFDEVTK